MPEKKLKIWFTDFWKGFNPYDNYFSRILTKHFLINISEEKPDLLIHSVFGTNYLKYKCIRICFTGENRRPDFRKSDYHIGFDYIDNPRYLRWPLFLLYYNPELLLQKNLEPVKKKTRFCSFVVSNDLAKERIDFFHKLNSIKKVDSGGNFLNNVGGPVKDKIKFIKESKFNIAFENESYPGYTTEKIYEAFLARTIPIYWGNPKIATDFNSKAFIHASNFKNFSELIDYIIHIDSDNELYSRYLQESPLIGNKVQPNFYKSKLVEFFQIVIEQIGKKPPVALRRKISVFYLMRYFTNS